MTVSIYPNTASLHAPPSTSASSVTSNELHLAYMSHLAPGCDYSVFAAVSRASRIRNVQTGVAGVLLFDGQRFFQWMYGIPDVASRLMTAIARDRRHTELSAYVDTLMPAADFPAIWRAGFVEEQSLDELVACKSSDAGQMLTAIGRVLEQADLDAPVTVTALRDFRLLGGDDEVSAGNL